MLKLVTGMQNKQGFTLIEILVVLLIIGITLGFALLAFGDFGSSRRVLMAAEQFVNYVKLAEQQAILESSTFGISINQQSYQILRFQAPNTWRPPSKNKIFLAQHFPDKTRVRLENIKDKKHLPQIIITAAGEITEFTLILSTKNQDNIVSVVGEPNGTVRLLKKNP